MKTKNTIDSLIIVHNGLNPKQNAYIDQITNAEEASFYVFPEDDVEAELTVLHEVLREIEKYEKETNEFPVVLFAVSVGEYVIPEVTDSIGLENIIHIDEQGSRFAEVAVMAER